MFSRRLVYRFCYDGYMAGSSSAQRPTGIARDPKEVRQLERELEATLERYELVWKATHDILYDLNLLDGTVVWNEALYEQFGYSKHESTTTLEWWVSHIHPDDALRVERELYNWFLDAENSWRSEYRFLKADGTYSSVLDRGTIIRNKDGEPVRIIGTLLDLTKQQELDGAKDEFVSLISHQLRTPLTVIRVYGEMFESGLLGALTDTQTNHITRMTDASIRLINLVDNILKLSRLEMGDYAIARSRTDVNRLLKRSIEAMMPLAEKKQISLSLTPNHAKPKAYLDDSLVEQIMENLLSNAIRYTRARSGLVKVSCHIEDGNIVIAVHDNGIGIPKADQKHVFERFYRARNAVNIEEHGTGLGLYIVRVLATALGGRVWFKSSRKNGTTFYLSLPL